MNDRTDMHRWVLALLQAANTGDVETTNEVLALVEREPGGRDRLLVCLSGMVLVAHGRDPLREDLSGFLAWYGAQLDAIDAAGTEPGD
ncbi:hypothetical protein [Paeniglutamicibacter sp.]|uniref:hypothetical protein n=1 Tax=Paeniglutamicibacter sp. TaxID=1934391 RepID=UPI0039896C72